MNAIKRLFTKNAPKFGKKGLFVSLLRTTSILDIHIALLHHPIRQHFFAENEMEMVDF
jgi:hypothetical protein